MEEYNIFYGCLDKIETLCRENDLTVDLTSTSYPFTIIVRSIMKMAVKSMMRLWLRQWKVLNGWRK